MEHLPLLKQTLFGLGDLVAGWHRFLSGHVERPAQLAVDCVLVGLLVVVAVRLARLTFDILRFVLIPSIIIAALVASISNFSFLFVLPFPMGIGTIVLLYKS